MSKMKQHLEKQLVIANSHHEETGWKRYLCFNYEGNEYELTLFWDEFNGYEIYWRSCNGDQINQTPHWAIAWDEEAHNGNTLEAYLDELTYERDK